MRAILTTVALASFVFACGGSSNSPGGGVGADGGPTGTASSSSSSSGASTSSSSSSGASTSSSSSGGTGSSSGTFNGSCAALGHTYSLHFTYVSGVAQCMTQTPMDQMQTFDPTSGPTDPAGETCTDNLSGCTYSQSCTTADDAGNTETRSTNDTVASDGTISGTAQIAASFVVLGQTVSGTCVYNVVGTKIN
jgi:hypothetical protein